MMQPAICSVNLHKFYSARCITEWLLTHTWLLHLCAPRSSKIEYKRPIITKSTATSAEQPATLAELSATAAKRRALTRGPQGERTESTFGLFLSRHVSAGKMWVKARRPSNSNIFLLGVSILFFCCCCYISLCGPLDVEAVFGDIYYGGDNLTPTNHLQEAKRLALCINCLNGKARQFQ